MQDWWQQTFPKGRQTVTIRDANNALVNLAYGEKGTGQPLLLVHGVASWSYAWRYNIEPLAEKFRVICFDAKGSGFSDKPLQPERSEHKAIELVRVMQALCDRPAVVVAESLGALATLAAIPMQPSLFDRLVLLNVPIFPKQLPNWGMRLLAEIPLDWVQTIDDWRLAQRLAPLIRPAIYALRGEVVTDATQITPEDSYWMTYPQLELPHTLTKLAAEFQLAARELRREEQAEPNMIRSIQANLSKITCPTLILWAENDRWFPVEDGQKLCDRLPHAQLQIIPNCGHYAAGGQPAFVNTAILTFLQASNDVR